MNMTAHERRYLAAAQADPRMADARTRNLLGVSPAHAELMLGMHARLHHGGKLTSTDVKQLQAIYPDASAEGIAGMAQQLNAVQPGQRADYFVGLVSGDRAAVESGDFTQRTADHVALDKLTTDYHRFGMAEVLNNRRNADTARDDKYTNRKDPVSPKADVLSTRQLIERQLEPAGARATAAAIERGDPEVVRLARHTVADRIERASETLGAAETSTRDAVAAAFELDAADRVGVDQGWIPAQDGEL